MVHLLPNVVCILFAISIRDGIASDIQVEVEQGTLAGELLTNVLNDTQYYSFKGIPYAKPPIGDLRFKAPQPPESWTGVRNATAHGDVCPQVNLLSNVYIAGNESCLYLNVYTPCLNCTELLPVLFFIHGGAYLFGSGDVDVYGPDFIVRKNVVLVTINYRLDFLGFLNLDTEEVPGNAGLKDQNAALKWVNKNIANFGGNPSNITIYGQSAGAASVAYHILSPMSEGLFQRAILQSGVPSLDCLVPYKSKERAFALGRKLGLDTSNVTELYNFLAQVPQEQLVNVTAPILAAEEETTVQLRFEYIGPVVEKDFGQERFIVDDPFAILESGNFTAVDVLFAYNSQESLLMIPLFYLSFDYIGRYNKFREMFVPSKITPKVTPDTLLELSEKIVDHYFGNNSVSVSNMKNFIDYANFGYIVYDVYRFFSRYPGNMYCGKFNGVSTRNYYGNNGADYGIIGASHLDDLLYMFDPKSLGYTLTTNTTEYEIVDLITTAYTNFVKWGNPTPDTSLGITWPTADKDNLSYVEITQNLTISTSTADSEEIQFWKSIFECADLSF